ncbi:MAG: hypothetical protein P8Y47_09890 [Alphaproteobacteria bacterium]
MRFPIAPVLAALAPVRAAVAPVKPVIIMATVTSLVVVHLIVEILVAMLAYIYLNLYHIDTFGFLIGLARELLNLLTQALMQLSPELAQKADATLLGDLGPKAFLLLVMGLVAGMLVRFVLWLIGRGVQTVKKKFAS